MSLTKKHWWEDVESDTEGSFSLLVIPLPAPRIHLTSPWSQKGYHQKEHK